VSSAFTFIENTKKPANGKYDILSGKKRPSIKVYEGTTIASSTLRL
jgi:hypothetical protein